MLAKDLVLAWAKQFKHVQVTLNVVISPLQTKFSVDCNLNKLLLNKTVRATLSMQSQKKKIMLASYGSAIHALD